MERKGRRIGKSKRRGERWSRWERGRIMRTERKIGRRKIVFKNNKRGERRCFFLTNVLNKFNVRKRLKKVCNQYKKNMVCVYVKVC